MSDFDSESLSACSWRRRTGHRVRKSNDSRYWISWIPSRLRRKVEPFPMDLTSSRYGRTGWTGVVIQTISIVVDNAALFAQQGSYGVAV